MVYIINEGGAYEKKLQNDSKKESKIREKNVISRKYERLADKTPSKKFKERLEKAIKKNNTERDNFFKNKEDTYGTKYDPEIINYFSKEGYKPTEDSIEYIRGLKNKLGQGTISQDNKKLSKKERDEQVRNQKGKDRYRFMSARGIKSSDLKEACEYILEMYNDNQEDCLFNEAADYVIGCINEKYEIDDKLLEACAEYIFENIEE